jgi:hypothetical protein
MAGRSCGRPPTEHHPVPCHTTTRQRDGVWEGWESHFMQLSSSRLFQPPFRWLSLIKMHRSNATLLCIKRLKFLILFIFSLGALSFAEFLREASLRDARGNYCPISGPFYLINGGLIACSVWKCILSASGLLYCEAYFNSDVKLLLWGFCRSQGLLLHSFVYFWYKQRGNSLKYLTGCKDSKHFPLYNIYLLAGYCQQI